MEEAKRVIEKIQQAKQSVTDQAISQAEENLSRSMNRHERRAFASKLQKAIKVERKKRLAFVRKDLEKHPVAKKADLRTYDPSEVSVFVDGVELTEGLPNAPEE